MAWFFGTSQAEGAGLRSSIPDAPIPRNCGQSTPGRGAPAPETPWSINAARMAEQGSSTRIFTMVRVPISVAAAQYTRCRSHGDLQRDPIIEVSPMGTDSTMTGPVRDTDAPTDFIRTIITED